MSPELGSAIASVYPIIMSYDKYRYLCMFNKESSQDTTKFISPYRKDVEFFIEEIHNFCYHGNLEMVKYGISLLPSPNTTPDINHWIELSCKSGNLELVIYLLKISTNTKNYYQWINSSAENYHWHILMN